MVRCLLWLPLLCAGHATQLEPVLAAESAAAASSPVTSISVVPAKGRTQIVIRVDSPFSVAHFDLRGPARVVIDLWTARHTLERESYPGIDRGGVRAVHVQQLRPDVVRIVAELERPVAYDIDEDEAEVRISFANPQAPFDPWHSGPRATLARGGQAEPQAGAHRRAPGPKPPAEPEPRARPRPEPPAPERPRVTVLFRDTPVLDVLSTFTEFSGRSIVAGSGVEGTVTAEIRDQPWDLALEEILRAHGLAAEETETGIIRVEALGALADRDRQRREREGAADLHTRHFRIRYVAVDSILPAVQGLLDERSNVAQNRNTNSLVVTAPGPVIERLGPALEQLDVPPPQVTISAKILFVDRTALRQYGIAYDLKDARGHRINSLFRAAGDPAGSDIVVELSGPGIAALANANVPLPSATLRLLGTLVRGRHSLTTFVEALQELSLSEIEAQPLITTLSHHEAYVQVGERTPIRIIDAGTGPGEAGVQPRATVDIQETGVILRATPHVTGDQVLLELHAENSRIALAPSDIGFTFQTQEATTQVLLNDGETSVISGLTILETNTVRTGIPFLKDIPLLGALFRGSSDQETRKDLLIMVTPHIVRAGPE
jgi:type IV pilus assembly protein PilQ